MNDDWGWKWAFLIQVPFIALATLLVVLFVWLPIEKATKPALRRVDYLGTITLVGAVVLLLLGLNFGGKNIAWTHWFVITSICLSIVLFVIFVWIEERITSEPIIPVRLLLKRTVAASCLTYLFFRAANFAILFYVPVYLRVTGLMTTEAGLRFIPQSACAAPGSILTGIVITSTGDYSYVNLFIEAITVLGYAFRSIGSILGISITSTVFEHL